MLSYSTQGVLANIIYAVADAERQLEISRQVLAEQNLFEPYTSYRRLDQQGNGELGVSEIIDFLKDNNISANQDEINYLFKKLDFDRNGRISYSDFLRGVLPREDRRLRSIASLRDSYYIDKNMLLPSEVEWALSQMMKQEIINYRQLCPIKRELINSLDYNSLVAFRTLDLFDVNFIKIDSLDHFMRIQNQPLSMDQLHAFFRGVDLDQDGRVTYEELVEAIHLMEPLPYKPSGLITSTSREINTAITNRRSLERLHLSQYPYYFYPYYPRYYPASIYPYLTLDSLRQRELSLERLNNSRLAVQRNSHQRKYDSLVEQSFERNRSIERLREIEVEGRLRQSRLLERQQQREFDQAREDELRQSQERLRQVEAQNMLKQFQLENRALELDREKRLIEMERINNLRNLEGEQRLNDSKLHLNQLERQSSLERLKHAQTLKVLDEDYFKQKLISPQRYFSNKVEYSPIKDKYPYVTEFTITEDIPQVSKVSYFSPIYSQAAIRRTMPYYQI